MITVGDISLIDYFVIPTLGRVHRQFTYNSLPEKYKERTYFTVQDHEYDEMREIYGDKVLRLPKEIKRIAPTREWIFNEFKDYRHMVFDDDLRPTVKEPNENITEESPNKWLTRYFTEQDFDDAFALLESWMDQGYAFGGLQAAWIVPDLRQWPWRENVRMMTNWFFDGPRIPRDLEWCRVDSGEDFDVNLQLLTRGFKNIVSTKYVMRCEATQAKGGCSEWRDLDLHNECQLELKEMWPDFISVKEKEITNGPWTGHKKLNLHIMHKKAYESSQRGALDEFFG